MVVSTLIFLQQCRQNRKEKCLVEKWTVWTLVLKMWCRCETNISNEISFENFKLQNSNEIFQMKFETLPLG